ncbi:MAG: site-specific DNA-methyltransferase, partial [Planctomycetes bacterium]|nr:site-specific DNA-methyltransferase [Planctomycetota bacterium]
MPKPPEYENKIITGDCLKVLPKLPDDCADLVFADPPFNIGYDYDGEYHDKRDSDEYISWCSEWIAACKRIMSSRGSL